jgi:aryl-alcohol dehydrogenase-like predicted oxidoreductase
MMFGRRTQQEDTSAIIDRAIGAGINFLDTANAYSRGRSEEFVGVALKRNGKRDQIVLATKVHGKMADDDPNQLGNSRRHIIQQCEASLRRLQTDWIDLYQIHRPVPDTAIDETLRALDDLIRSGKVRYVGTSTFAAWQVVESLWASKELGLNRFISEQPPYNLLDRQIEQELIPMAQTFGLAILPWSPLAGGFLTGKYKRDQADPAEGRYKREGNQWWTRDVDKWWASRNFNPEAFAVVERLEQLAAAKGCNTSQVALAWCAQQPGVTSPIIGPRTLEQLEDNLGACELTLSDDDLRAIDEVAPPKTTRVTYYQADFGPHRHRW